MEIEIDARTLQQLSDSQIRRLYTLMDAEMLRRDSLNLAETPTIRSWWTDLRDVGVKVGVVLPEPHRVPRGTKTYKSLSRACAYAQSFLISLFEDRERTAQEEAKVRSALAQILMTQQKSGDSPEADIHKTIANLSRIGWFVERAHPGYPRDFLLKLLLGYRPLE